jgi:hypothetical protein
MLHREPGRHDRGGDRGGRVVAPVVIELTTEGTVAMMAKNPLVLAVVSEPEQFNAAHYTAVAAKVTAAGGRIVPFDGPRSPAAQRGLSVQLEGGRTIVSIGEEEVSPDAVWWWDPIGRERDGLVSAAVQAVVDPGETLLAQALRQVLVSPSLEVLGDLAHRDLLRHIAALETAFPERIYVNRPEALRRAASKPYNLQAAADHGFRVPLATLFAQEPGVARRWVGEQHRRGRKVLWKFAPNATYTGQDGRLRKVPATELTPQNALDFPYETVRHLPLIFQTIEDGDRDLRVVVVPGQGVFAAQIVPAGERATLDPRVGAHRYEPYPLHPGFEDACANYVEQRLGLGYAVIDFRLSPDRGPVFLEAQGDGTFWELERDTPQDVSGALARQLLTVAQSRT